MTDETIGSALKRAREDAGFTPRDVSRASGVSVNQISQIETGRRPDPAFTTVARIDAGLLLPLESVSRAIGLAVEAPPLKSRVTSAGRKHLSASRELEDVAEVAVGVSDRIRSELKCIEVASDKPTNPLLLKPARKKRPSK